MPFRLAEKERQFVLMHERYHIKRKDYLVKRAAFMLVIVHWFNPLVWLAFCLMSADMEISCDEKVISKLSMEMRKEDCCLHLLPIKGGCRLFRWHLERRIL